MAIPFPGHLRAVDLQHYSAIRRLLQLYDAFEPFRADASAARASSEQAQQFDLQASGAQRSREIVGAFARRWNLDRIPELAESDCRRVRRGLERAGDRVGQTTVGLFTNIGFSAFEPEDPLVEWDGRSWVWRLGSGEPLAECRERIVRDLDVANQRALPAAVRDQLTALPEKARAAGWILVDRRHSLDRHLGWLFLRLCPHPDQPWSPARIVKDEQEQYGVQLNERAVRSATDELAESLRIELPRLRPGRPRRARGAN